MRFSGTPLADPVPAPSIGEHTEKVLRETLGYSSEKIRALIQSGAVFSPTKEHDNTTSVQSGVLSKSIG